MGEDRRREEDRMRDYVAKMRPVFRKRAVHSDETRFFRTPFEPKPGDDVTIRIRTYRNNVTRSRFRSKRS